MRLDFPSSIPSTFFFLIFKKNNNNNNLEASDFIAITESSTRVPRLFELVLSQIIYIIK